MHYIVKRMSKSLIIQSVHFSGLREQLDDSMLAFIKEQLNPMDLLNLKGNMMLKPPILNKPKDVPNNAFDEMIMKLNHDFA